MRIVFIGASEITQHAARLALQRGCEVVIIESDKDRIDRMAEQVDAGFIHGNGSHPAILREAAPEHTDILFCLTNDDLVNITGALIGRSMGVERVVPKIEDESYEGICRELGLQDTIIPSRTIGRYLADLIDGRDPLELSTLIKHGARFVGLTASEDDDGVEVRALDLPERTRVVCLYRDDEVVLPDPGSRLREGDEVVLITHLDRVEELRARSSVRGVRVRETPEG